MRQDQRRPVSEGGRRQSALLVVTNRRAGGANRLDDALGALRQGSPDVVTIDTSDARLQEELRGAKGRTVVAAGGDGTLNVVVQTLWRLGALADTVLGVCCPWGPAITSPVLWESPSTPRLLPRWCSPGVLVPSICLWTMEAESPSTPSTAESGG